MENPSRREFTTRLLHSFMTLSLVETLLNGNALGKSIAPDLTPQEAYKLYGKS
jgi:hypothetical protein